MTLYDRIQIEGIMPERALIRLKRVGIPLYDVKKTDKNKLLLRVKRKDMHKIFTIYPSLDEGERRAYTVTKMGGAGCAKIVDFCKNRAGFLLGGLAFCILTLAADTFVFQIEFVGADVYARETAQALEESGVRLFAPYKNGQEDFITAKLLSLDYVEFCSVQKVGGRVRVETRLSPFTVNRLSKGEMRAKHTGEILSITILRGSAMKNVGDTVAKGETLVADSFFIEEKGQVRVEPIARATIACVYEGEHEGLTSEEQAFAEAYLALDLQEKDEIKEVCITQIDGKFHVKIDYIVTESMNL
jgi:hypothetical protein